MVKACEYGCSFGVNSAEGFKKQRKSVWRWKWLLYSQKQVTVMPIASRKTVISLLFRVSTIV